MSMRALIGIPLAVSFAVAFAQPVSADDPLDPGETLVVPPRAPGTDRRPYGTGPVLDGDLAVRERERRIEIEVRGIEVRVRYESTLVNTSEIPQRVLFREPRFPGARLRRIEECAGGLRCAWRDLNGGGAEELDLVVPPADVSNELARGERLVRTEVVVDSIATNGLRIIELPVRLADPRTVRAFVSVIAGGTISLNDGSAPAVLAEEQPIVVHVSDSRATPGATSARVGSCGGRPCARLEIPAFTPARQPASVLLVIDGSRSMDGPARGRAAEAVAALARVAPERSTIRVISFGAESEIFVADAVPLDADHAVMLAELATRDAGAATRLSSAIPNMRALLVRDRADRVVIVGDGGSSDDDARAFDALARGSARVDYIDVGDGEAARAWHELAFRTGGVVVDAARSADTAARHSQRLALSAAVGSVFQPTALRGIEVRRGRTVLVRANLVAGSDFVWSGPFTDVSAVLAGRRVAFRRSAQTFGFYDPALDAPRSSLVEPPVAEPARRGIDRIDPPRFAVARPPSVPREAILHELTRQLVPRARDCFRRDRAGRAQYSTRAALRFEVRDAEVSRVRATSAASPVLASCIRDALDEVRWPASPDRILISYPMVTEAVATEPVIELENEVAEEVDRAITPERP